jgi:hypothetical protein
MVTMKAYVDHIHDELQAELDRRVEEIRSNIAISREEMTKRLDGMNEFRLALSDREKYFLTREVMDQIVLSLRQQSDQQDARLREVERWQMREAGSAQGQAQHQGQQQAMSSTRIGLYAVLASVAVVIVNVAIALTFHQP